MFNSMFVIIGTIIGAGFASGKEIFNFFNVYGTAGLVGLFLSEIIIGFVLYKTFYIILKFNIDSYNKFIKILFSKFNFLSNVMCNIISIFLLISFIVMVAGFAAYFAQEFNIPYMFGAILISVFSFIIFLKNIDAIIKVNTYFIPCLIILIIMLGFKNINCFTQIHSLIGNFSLSFIIKALLYASYNLIIAIPILISLRKYVSTKKQAKFISLGVSFFLLLLSVIIFFLLNYYYLEIETFELPTVYIAAKSNIFYQFSCGIVILGAIFTTAISNGYGFLTNLNISNKKTFVAVAFVMCVLATLLSHIGFATLLNLLYPILGFIRVNTNYIYNY